MRHPLDSPEVQEALEAARRQGYAEASAAGAHQDAIAGEQLRNMRRVLWAAAMTHGGKLRVSATYIALAHGPADECQLEELWDPAHDETVVTARRRAFYRSPDGKGWMHVNMGRRAGPAPCAAPRLETDDPTFGERCGRIGGKLCDAPVGKDLAGKALTCDMPLCELHATHVADKDLDYCPRHAGLASRLPV